MQQNKIKYPIGSMFNGYEVLAPQKRPTILLLSDDLRHLSGIATVSRQFVTHTAHRFN